MRYHLQREGAVMADPRDPAYSHGRWCERHKRYHGDLYICSSYPSELQQEIQVKSDRYVSLLQDPVWRKEQIDAGVPPEVLNIVGILAGLVDCNTC